MAGHAGSCPLTQRQIADAYFLEQRTKILEIAAFLDRLDRAAELDGHDDFRLQASRRALRTLSEGPGRAERVQLLFSDPRSELLPEPDRQSARGAYDEGEVL